ncbi:hypothetical protein Vau01_124600 [Virgisporangium aurantiacum]|uniref:Uncharacterized protein n=1 Tax=Virgisporangium aurantiacum TaxID=175570 RepID=A0A8J4E835_9ACTN|nr:hypothetical protein Vau01_124600 [Virgisporangium aurantiacum]
MLIVAVGCSKPDDGKDVASVNGSAAPRASGSAPSLTSQERDLKYAQCMRQNGVQMSDPIVSGNDVTFRVEGEPDRETFAKATEACKQYQNKGGDGGPMPAVKIEASRWLAKCMRDKGVESFPDPDADGGFSTDKSVEDDPQFADAKKFCDAEFAKKYRSGP